MARLAGPSPLFLSRVERRALSPALFALVKGLALAPKTPRRTTMPKTMTTPADDEDASVQLLLFEGGTNEEEGLSLQLLESPLATTKTTTRTTTSTNISKKKKKNTCKTEGCSKYAVKAGVCVAHGANKQYKKCDIVECNNFAQKGGVCARHGATRQRKVCSVVDCTNIAQSHGVCRRHGAKRHDRKKCNVQDCNKIAQQGGVCIAHGAKKKRCSEDGCERQVQKRGVCFTHGARHFMNHSSEEEDVVLEGEGGGIGIPYFYDNEAEKSPQKKRAKTTTNEEPPEFSSASSTSMESRLLPELSIPLLNSPPVEEYCV